MDSTESVLKTQIAEIPRTAANDFSQIFPEIVSTGDFTVRV